jgi:hypothetical protein
MAGSGGYVARNFVPANFYQYQVKIGRTLILQNQKSPREKLNKNKDGQ